MGRSYEDLIVWQKAMALVTAVYTATEGFPAKEMYGLTQQMRRAAVSIASNIAEGQGRLTPGEFRHALGMARGSLMELETQVQVARNLGFLEERSLDQLLDATAEVGRLLNGLINAVPVPPHRELRRA